MQTLHQRPVFALRVADDHMVARFQQHIYHFALTRKGFAAARCAEYQPVRRSGVFAVKHYHVVALGVQPVIQGVAALKQFLRHERDENCHAGSSQRPLDFDLIQSQRQTAHNALFLLEVKAGQRTVVFLRHASGTENIVVQLPCGVPVVEYKECSKEKTFIAVLQLV